MSEERILVDISPLLDKNVDFARNTLFANSSEKFMFKCGVKEVLDRLEALPTIDPETLLPQWVRTEKILPEYEKPVLVYTSEFGGLVTVATLEHDLLKPKDREKDKWWLYMDDEGCQITRGKVTHWMPLPEPPKEVSRNATD